MLRTLSAFILATATAGAVELTIVSSLPRSGSANAQTTTIVNGIRLAIKQAGGAVAGHPIRYLDLDDASPERGEWDGQIEKANAKRAIEDATVVAYIGTYNSGAAKLVMPELNLAGLAMISPANTYVGLTKPGLGEAGEPEKYRPSGKVTYFRVVPADDIQGQVGAQWAKDLEVRKAFVLHDRQVYGKGLADVFRSAAGKLGIEVVGYEGIDPSAPNFKALVTKIRMTGPDLVYFGGTNQSKGGQIAKELAQGGLASVKFMAPDGCFESSFLASGGGSALDGRVFLTFGGVPPERLTGKGAEFVAAYRAEYQGEPEAYSAYGYECAQVVLDAIARAADRGTPDRASVLTAIHAQGERNGVLGAWSFDAQGDTTLTLMSGNTVKDGKFTFVRMLGR